MAPHISLQSSTITLISFLTITTQEGGSNGMITGPSQIWVPFLNKSKPDLNHISFFIAKALGLN